MGNAHQLIMSKESIEIHAEIWPLVANVSASWIIFKQLFSEGEEELRLMNDVAPSFFLTIQWALYESIVLGICRLSDPAKDAYNNQNLSLRLLEGAITDLDKKAGDRVKNIIDSYTNVFKPLRQRRHKQIAHLDRLKKDMLPANRNEIQKAVDALTYIMNEIDPFFASGRIAYESPIQSGDGTALLSILKDYVTDTRNK